MVNELRLWLATLVNKAYGLIEGRIQWPIGSSLRYDLETPLNGESSISNANEFRKALQSTIVTKFSPHGGDM